jgi:hypothetical protein
MPYRTATTPITPAMPAKPTPAAAEWTAPAAEVLVPDLMIVVVVCELDIVRVVETVAKKLWASEATEEAMLCAFKLIDAASALSEEAMAPVVAPASLALELATDSSAVATFWGLVAAIPSALVIALMIELMLFWGLAKAEEVSRRTAGKIGFILVDLACVTIISNRAVIADGLGNRSNESFSFPRTCSDMTICVNKEKSYPPYVLRPQDGTKLRYRTTLERVDRHR